jgi:hypothetical protein
LTGFTGLEVFFWKVVSNDGEANTKWLIVELDRCATDMLEAVEKSNQYLASL